MELSHHIDVLLADTVNLGRIALDRLPDCAGLLYNAVAASDVFAGTSMIGSRRDLGGTRQSLSRCRAGNLTPTTYC
jgi:hypothetical protein